MENAQNELDRLWQELKRQKLQKQDYIVHARSLSVARDADHNRWQLGFDLEGGKQNFNITEHTHGQISQKTKIPKRHYDRLRDNYPELFQAEVNGIMNNPDIDEVDRKHLVRTLDGKARAFLSNSYRVVDNYDILVQAMTIFDRMNKENHMDIKIDRGDLTETRLYIKATSETLIGEVFGRLDKKVGDPVRGGIVISNSEVGAGAVRVMPFMTNLACMNGMVRDVGIHRVHIGRKHKEVGEIDWSEQTRMLEDQTLMSQIQDMITSTFTPEIFSQWLEDLNRKAIQEIPKPQLAVNNVVRNFNIKDENVEALTAQFMREGPTRWGLANAVTFVAQHQEDYEHQIEMEKIGGQIMEVPMKVLQQEEEKSS